MKSADPFALSSADMTIRFLCPRGHKLAVPDNLAGKKGRCPVCQQRVYIPVIASSDEPSETASAGIQAPPVEPSMAPPPTWAAETAVAVPPLGGEPSLAPPTAGIPPLEGERAGPPPIPPSHVASGDPLAAAPPQPAGAAWLDAPVLPPPAGPAGEPSGGQELAVIIDEPEPEGYQADPGKVQTVYMLALALGALTLLCAAPALSHLNLIEAPNWARVVLVASALQLIFICWMISLPDWSTVWIAMVVFAVVAALYGVAWAVITFTPDYMPVNFLDLDEPPDDPIRRRAGPWCLVMLMLATLLTYACGRFSGRWRKQYELAKALRE